MTKTAENHTTSRWREGPGNDVGPHTYRVCSDVIKSKEGLKEQLKVLFSSGIRGTKFISG